MTKHIFVIVLLLVIFSSNLHKEESWEVQAENLIMQFESFREKPYICKGGKLSIGYGTKAKKSEIIDKNEAVLRMRKHIKDNIKIPDGLTNNQKIALTSFVYNVGGLKDVYVNGKLNCEKILQYNYSKGKKLDGLVKRRKIEFELCKK